MTKIGIYNPYLDTRGGGEKVCLALASVLADAANNEVYLISHEEADLKGTAEYFGIDATRLKTVLVKPSLVAKLVAKLPILGGVKHYFYDLSTYRAIKKKNYDLFINNCYQSNLPNPSSQGVYMCMFPQKLTTNDSDSFLKRIYWVLLRGLYRLTLHGKSKHAVYTYDLITANSKYTQDYIKKYWGTDSAILYPICEDMHDSTYKEKEKVILNVGRFFEKTENNHHKRQDFLIDSFKELSDLHSKGWELHLAGSVAEDVGGLKYILELMKSSTGYPVVFHFNSSFDNMKRLYSKASIYWHATGYGVSQTAHPEKQEHFGISTVEAMSAGAIPIVIDSAGQKETVQNGENGYLWSSQEELTSYTNTLVSLNSEDAKNIREAAKQTAKNYSYDAFKKSCLTIFDQ